MEDRLRKGSAWGLGALGGLLAVTFAWWALALWPAGDAAPGWVATARSVCFGAAPDGLPDAAGWAALVGQPVVMLGILLFGWAREIAGGLRVLARRPGGRALLGLPALLVLGGLVAAALRVASAAPAAPAAGEGATPAARADGGGPAEAGAAVPETYPRLDRPAPPLGLVDQRGRRVELGDLAGGPVLVTFAYAHCETVCPAVVADVLEARRRLAAGGTEAWALVVTLDPWRDTPGRLPHIAEGWGLGPRERVLGGAVDSVEAVLDAWTVSRSRDRSDGQITHPRLTYVLGPDGRIAYAASGGTAQLVELAGRAAGP